MVLAAFVVNEFWGKVVPGNISKSFWGARAKLPMFTPIALIKAEKGQKPN